MPSNHAKNSKMWQPVTTATVDKKESRLAIFCSYYVFDEIISFTEAFRLYTVIFRDNAYHDKEKKKKKTERD